MRGSVTRSAALWRAARWRAAPCLVGVGLAVAPAAPAAAQPDRGTTAIDQAAGARPIGRLDLVRCVEDRPLPCLSARVTLDRATAERPSSGGASGGATARWTGSLGPYALQSVGERTVFGDGPPQVVLVLVDASGSMAGEGVQAARAAVRSFLRDLGREVAATGTPGALRVGVAAFSSRGVVAGVRTAAFGSPDAAAEAVGGLAPPAGNTGLYSAVAAGAERAAAEARTAGPGARAALVVVTDGRNDVRDAAGRVRPGDDANLLDGLSGRAEAADVARRLGVALYFVGVGGEPDMGELQALAGPGGLAFRSALDAVSLQASLADVRQALAPTREVVFVVLGAERASLTGAGWPVALTRAAGDGAGTPQRFAARWRAPLLTAPAFDGTAFPVATAPAWLRTATPAALIGQRETVAIFLVALALGVWWLPRVLWSPNSGSPRPGARGALPATPATPVTRSVRTIPLASATAATATTGAANLRQIPSAVERGAVRADVREAAPRRSSDVTGEFAVPTNPSRREQAAGNGVRHGRTFAIRSPAPSPPPPGRPPRPDPD